MRPSIRLLLVMMLLLPFTLQANEPVTQDDRSNQSAETADKKSDKAGDKKKKKSSGGAGEEPDCE